MSALWACWAMRHSAIGWPMYSSDELRLFLRDTRTELQAEGHEKEALEKLTRRAFEGWLDEYVSALSISISASLALPAEGREERKTRASSDFGFFMRTYLPHYLTLDGSCALHDDLDALFTQIVTTPDGRKYARAAPRGHAKTTRTSIGFALWCAVFNKKRFIVQISDAVELAETNIEAIKAELEDNPRLLADFPEACGAGPVWRIGEIVTNGGVKIKGFGSGKRLRGVRFGIYRPDLVIIDDLENDTNVRSRDQRDKLENWLDEAVLNLGSVDGSMDVLYIGTVLHRDSVLSRKLATGYWNPRRYQAVIQFPKRLDLWDEYARIYKAEGADAAHAFYADRKETMSEGAKVLWEAVGLERLMRIRAENPRAFAKEQQNAPTMDTARFSREKMRFWKNLPSDLKYYGWCDPAGNGKKSDFTNFSILGVSAKERKGYLVESINKIISSREIVATVVELQKRYRCKKFGIETNGGQFHLKPFVLEAAFDAGVTMPLVGVHNTDNKEERIEELELPIENGELLLHESFTLLIEQLEDFPEGAHDDAPDGAAGVYRLSKLAKAKLGGKTRRKSVARDAEKSRLARIRPRRPRR